MKRRFAESILLLLLVGTLALSFSIQPGRANYAWTETIYIRANGSVEPSAAPISTADNTTYVLTDNIVGPVPYSCSAIVIERDNIVVDGAGHTLQGTGVQNSDGIELTGRSNVTVKNVRVTAFWFGILLSSSDNNTLYGNNITANNYGGPTPHMLDGPPEVETFGEGVWLYSSSNNTLYGNDITNNGYGVVLGSSSNNTLYGNNIEANNWYGILLDDSSANSIVGNNIEANHAAGIVLALSCSYNVIIGNKEANSRSGILLDDFSNDNTLYANNITRNEVGVWLRGGASSNTLCENDIANNGEGVWLEGSSGNVIFHNSFINSNQVSSSDSISVWDNGYEGNYWGDYNGTDVDGDGIGETPYIIDRINQDNYPLMNPYWNPADVNHDLKVDVKDVYLCAKTFGSLNGDLKWNPAYDMNHDGRIDLKDIWLICRNFGKTYS